MDSNRQHIVFVSGTLIAILIIGVLFSPTSNYDAVGKAKVMGLLANPNEVVVDKVYTIESTIAGAQGMLTCVELGRVEDGEYSSGLIGVYWHGDGRTSTPWTQMDTKNTSELARLCQDF